MWEMQDNGLKYRTSNKRKGISITQQISNSGMNLDHVSQGHYYHLSFITRTEDVKCKTYCHLSFLIITITL